MSVDVSFLKNLSSLLSPTGPRNHHWEAKASEVRLLAFFEAPAEEKQR